MNNDVSLRDFFAAQALQSEAIKMSARWDVEKIASRCYELADAMLQARNRYG